MSTVTPPQALTLGTALNVPYPASGQFGNVVLSNLSPYLLQVVVSGDLFWLAPWTAQVYALQHNTQNPVQVSPSLVPGTTVTSGSSATLTATWYVDGEHLDGTYPLSLTANAIGAAIAGLVSTQNPVTVLDNSTFVIGVYPFSWARTITLPSNCNAIDIYIDANGLPARVTVTGVTTGFVYLYQGVLTVNGISYLRIPVNPVSDPQILVSGLKALGSFVTMRVVTVARTDVGVVAAFGSQSQAADAAVPIVPLIPDDAVIASATFTAPTTGAKTLFASSVGLSCDGAIPYRVYAIWLSAFNATATIGRGVVAGLMGGVRMLGLTMERTSTEITFPGGVLMTNTASAPNQSLVFSVDPTVSLTECEMGAIVRFNV